MKESETARLIRLLRTLPLAEAVFLSTRVEPRAIAKQWRLDERDDAIRLAASFLHGMDDGPRASHLALDLERYVANGGRWRGTWRAMPIGYRVAIYKFVVFNEGQFLGARQLLNIFRYSRLHLRKQTTE